MRTSTPASVKTGQVRQIAVFVWAALLSLFFIPGLVGLTSLTIGLWLAHQNQMTTPVGDLSFFALSTIIIGSGCVVQLRHPERHVAGIQQSLLGLLALAVAGLLGARIEPLVGGLLFLLALLLLAALHPTRRVMFTVGPTVSAPLLAWALLAVLPALLYAAHLLVLAREAGPSCFLGRCAYGDRFAEMAACAVAIVLVAVLAALQPPGWRLPAWSAGVAAIFVGAASFVLPDVPGALGQVGGALAVAWGALLLVVSEREAHAHARTVRDLDSAARGSQGPTSHA